MTGISHLSPIENVLCDDDDNNLDMREDFSGNSCEKTMSSLSHKLAVETEDSNTYLCFIFIFSVFKNIFIY